VASGFLNIWKIPELRKRILFTIALLGVYRVGVFIPVPGANRQAITDFFKTQGGNTVFGLYDMFTGGALEQFSIFTLGIMPYISASIILQLLTVVIPSLERLQKEGEAGRRKITQYTRYGTVIISIVQGFAIAYGLESMSPAGTPVVADGGPAFWFMTVLTLTCGTAFIMWLGEQITERGIGNGISLIIMAGIVARFPASIYQSFQGVIDGTAGGSNLTAVGWMILVVAMICVIAFIVFCERGQRRIPVQYAKRVVGRRVYGGQQTHLPLKINTAGVIPPIFASSIIMFPATIATFWQTGFLNQVQNWFQINTYLYNVTYIGLTIFFCYFYTAVTFNPTDVAENLKKHGGFIPGIRPGKNTAEFIDRVLTRITLVGSLYISAVCVMPNILIIRYNVPFNFGGTSLLIVVGVALDTVSQIESHLLTRHYDGLMGAGGTRIRGRSKRG